jgi:hypothetical protein
MLEIGPRPAGDHPNPGHWERIRAAALARDGTCRLCRDARQLECHHNTYDRWGREELDDVIIICRGCHDLVTGAQMRIRDQRREMPLERITVRIERVLVPSAVMPDPVRETITVERLVLPETAPPPPPTRQAAVVERPAPPGPAGMPVPARNNVPSR